MQYGSIEYAYAAPIADSLAASETFRRWLIEQTRFAAFREARLLHDEMRLARSQAAQNWWRSHYTEACRCRGCRGQETDLLAIFERDDATRFALHCEIKQPTDGFPADKKQGVNYNVRAQCWTKSTPKNVLAHGDADTMLVCSRYRLGDYGDNTKAFGSVVTFQQIANAFPEIGEAFPSARN